MDMETALTFKKGMQITDHRGKTYTLAADPSQNPVVDGGSGIYFELENTSQLYHCILFKDPRDLKSQLEVLKAEGMPGRN
jgi:hypothetical protein